jgi:hypothetical protein
MKTFANRDEAKQFFIDQILAEAKVEKKNVTPLEVKMLWFTEEYPVPGMDVDALDKVCDEFDDTFDSREWEGKIVGLLQRGYQNSSKPENFRAAYAVIADEDHYLLVMVDKALGSKLQKKVAGK